MSDAPDAELLEQFARNQSEAAFAALVSRYIGLVYSTAFRKTDNPQHAEDITQAVFIVLARKAGSLGPKTVLPGWLYHTTRLTAANLQRAELRRIRREQEVFMQSTLKESAPDALWRELSPLLEDAMAGLGASDRDAIVLRFFQNRSLADVGVALGIAERAAQKRVNRALEKLRKFFAQRGVSSTTAIIAGAISSNSVQAAPVALAKSVTAMAIAKGAAASASTLTLVKGALKIMAWTKTKTAVAAGIVVLLAAGTTTMAIHSPRGQNLFVSDWDEPGAIFEYKPGSHRHTTFHRGDLGEPEEIAFDRAGNLYVADSAGGNVDIITPDGSESTFVGGFNNPSALAFNRSGTLFMGDGRAGIIYEITPDKTVSTFVSSGLNGPSGLAFDAAGNLFEADRNTGNILEFKNVGGTLSTTPTIFASNFVNLFGLAFNGAGDLYVSYDGDDGVTSGGVTEILPGGVEKTILTGLDVPNDLAFDRSGDLFVTDSHNGHITELSASGRKRSFDAGNNVTGIAFQGIALPIAKPSVWELFVSGVAAPFALFGGRILWFFAIAIISFLIGRYLFPKNSRANLPPSDSPLP